MQWSMLLKLFSHQLLEVNLKIEISLERVYAIFHDASLYPPYLFKFRVVTPPLSGVEGVV